MTTPRKPPGTVRIVGGRWKRTVLPVVDAPDLRPTPDRVRETLFNWLVHALGSLEGRAVLDLFAGTGALGFEAASRGAAPVTLVERHPRAAERLRASVDKLAAGDVEVVAGEALSIVRRLRSQGRLFDVVFLDPPFDSGLLAPALTLAADVTAPAGLIYVEGPAALEEDGALPGDFAIWRAGQAGDVFYHLLQRKQQDPRGDPP